MPKGKKQIGTHTITRAATMLFESMTALGAKPPRSLCEEVAVLVIKAMSTRNRAFHDVQHAFDVAEVPSPIGKIAGLFHDIVYIQVDRSRLPELRQNFSVFDPKENFSLKIPSQEVLAHDPWRVAITDIFGFVPHQEVGPNTGINEFLSAWICICKLRDHLDPWALIQVVACIEATIPFRGVDASGKSVSELLFERLKNVKQKWNLAASEADIELAVQVAVSVANQDVIGFGTDTPAAFIGNSWMLLLEGNPPLQNAMFTALDFRDSLYKMYKFFSFLSPEKVFRQYKGSPDLQAYSKLVEGARTNICVGAQYIQIHLIEKTLLDVLAQATGGNCPFENWVGDRPKAREVVPVQAEQFLNHQLPEVAASNWNMDVLKLLEDGRQSRSHFDTHTAKIGAFIYRRSTQADIKRYLSASIEVIEGKLPIRPYLELFEPALLQNLIHCFSQIAWSRREHLADLAAALPQPKKSVA